MIIKIFKLYKMLLFIIIFVFQCMKYLNIIIYLKKKINLNIIIL